jgi:recombinational DNA repair protein RecT
VYLATQAGVHDIQCDVVYKADEFKLERRSDGDFFSHTINILAARDGETNPFLGTYVAARMPKSGERKVEWVPREDIFRMRDKSDSYTDDKGAIRPNSPWVQWFDEQAKKSGLKRAVKRWEETIDDGSRWQRLHAAIDLDHKAESGTTIEGAATEVEEQKLSVDQIAAIEAAAKEVGHGDVNKFLRRICAAYGTEVLADLPAKHFREVLERIAVSKAEMQKRRAGKGAAK